MITYSTTIIQFSLTRSMKIYNLDDVNEFLHSYKSVENSVNFLNINYKRLGLSCTFLYQKYLCATNTYLDHLSIIVLFMILAGLVHVDVSFVCFGDHSIFQQKVVVFSQEMRSALFYT